MKKDPLILLGELFGTFVRLSALYIAVWKGTGNLWLGVAALAFTLSIEEPK